MKSNQKKSSEEIPRIFSFILKAIVYYHHRRCISSAVGYITFHNDDIHTHGVIWIHKQKMRKHNVYRF